MYTLDPPSHSTHTGGYHSNRQERKSNELPKIHSSGSNVPVYVSWDHSICEDSFLLHLIITLSTQPENEIMFHLTFLNEVI